MKKRLFSLLLVAVFVFSLAAAGFAAIAADDVSAEIASVKGKVTVKRVSSEKLINAFAGMKLKQGDVVTTAKGAETVVDISIDMSVKALSDSSFKITTLSASGTGFTLIKGTVFNQVRSKDSGNSVSVQTGNTVVGVRGTTYIVSLRGNEDDGSTIVRTLEGTVFLDNVRKRLEADDNASLIREQTEVGAGEGYGTDGVYSFGIDDLLADELQYILEHPDEFDTDIVDEAQKTLDNLPPDEGGDDSDDVIRYLPEKTQPEQPGPSGPSTTYYTVTFTDNALDGNIDYYTPGGTIRVAAGSTIAPSQFPPAVRVGFSLLGWFDREEDAPTSAPAEVEYIPGVTPVTGDVTLYPWWDWTDTSWGDGSYGDEYIITPANFPHFRYFVHFQYGGLNAYYKLTDDINCADYTLNSQYGWDWDWMPIGDDNAAFSGSFDGDGKTISNFTCTDTSGDSTDKYAGFFGYVDGSYGNGEITNLRLSGSINIINSLMTSSLYIGGIAGTLVNGKTELCSADVTISASTNGNIFIGGIVGEQTMNSTIAQCSSSRQLNAVSNSSVAGTVCTGGIAGISQGGVPTVMLLNCYSTADVTAETSASDMYAYAGGIVGQINGASTLSTCYYRGGSVAANNATSVYNSRASAGGIAGYIEATATIEHCVVYSGSVTVSSLGDHGRIWGNSGYFPSCQDNYSSTDITGFSPPVSSTDPLSMTGADVNPTHLEVLGWWDGTNTGGPPIVASPWNPGTNPWDFGSVWVWIAGSPYPQLQ